MLKHLCNKLSRSFNSLHMNVNIIKIVEKKIQSNNYIAHMKYIDEILGSGKTQRYPSTCGQVVLAPFFVNREKDLYLFSHHFKGMVWEISSSVRGLPPLRGHNFTADANKDCPDADLKWEIYNSTSTESQHVYIEDNHVKVECTETIPV